MQGIEQIIHQNACKSARNQAGETGEIHYVVAGDNGRENVVPADALVPGSDVRYTAHPDGPEL